MDIYLLQQEVHHTAKEHGWWDEPRRLPEIIALCHSELSEALEAYRNDEPLFYVNAERGNKPEGVATEMADCIIRILDWFGAINLDINDVIIAKNMYNKNRPYRHGGKKA